MRSWKSEKADSARRGPRHRLTMRLAAAAMAVALGLGTSIALAQEAQQVPAPTAPAQQAPAPEGPAQPELELTERQIQDWMVRCGRPEGQEQEVCEMQQQQVDSEDRTVMAVAVGRVPGTSNVGLLILLPLGILLPAGVTMQIDGGAAIPLEVERCEREGCRIERILEPDLLNRLKAGTKATVFFQAVDPQGKRQRLGVPISLLGFTAALNEVTS